MNIKPEEITKFTEQLKEYFSNNSKVQMKNSILDEITIEYLGGNNLKIEAIVPGIKFEFSKVFTYKIEENNGDFFNIIKEELEKECYNVVKKWKEKQKKQTQEKEEKIEKIEKQLLEVSTFVADIRYKMNTCAGKVVEGCIFEYWTNKEQELFEELKDLKGEK